MTRDQLISELVKANGAMLYWQLPKETVEAAVKDGLCYIADDDCLVHRDAIKADDGSYKMDQS